MLYRLGCLCTIIIIMIYNMKCPSLEKKIITSRHGVLHAPSMRSARWYRLRQRHILYKKTTEGIDRSAHRSWHLFPPVLMAIGIYVVESCSYILSRVFFDCRVRLFIRSTQWGEKRAISSSNNSKVAWDPQQDDDEIFASSVSRYLFPL